MGGAAVIERPLTICQISPSDVGGGAELCVLSLHESLLRLGHNSHLFVARKVTDQAGVHEIPYVRGLPGLRRLARWVEAKTGLQDIYNPSFINLRHVLPPSTDIIHFHNLWGAAGYADLGALPALTREIPGVFTEHQHWSFSGHCACHFDCDRWRSGCGKCPDLSIPPKISRDATRWNWNRKKRLIQRSNLSFVGVSDYVCSLARQSPIWEGKPVTRIYNGINTKVFAPVDAETKKALRRGFAIPADKVAVLLTGQTLGGYREGIATEGFQAINALGDASLIPVLVGREPEQAARNLEMKSITIDHRATPEAMAACYQACDLTLVTSKVEAFGRIGAESQACGTPVIAFATGGIPEVVKEGSGGMLVPAGDVEGLVQRMQTMIGDKNLREALGKNGVRWVREWFDDHIIADNYIQLFNSALCCEMKCKR